jgi:hypothetical protein
VREVRGRVREMTKYLDPARTLGLGVLAVPDAVYGITPEAHAEGYRDGILVVPYSLALPFLLVLYRLVVRFGPAAGAPDAADVLRRADEALLKLDEEIEGRLSRSLVQLGNARDALREHLALARRGVASLLRDEGAGGPEGPEPGTGLAPE